MTVGKRKQQVICVKQLFTNNCLFSLKIFRSLITWSPAFHNNYSKCQLQLGQTRYLYANPTHTLIANNVAQHNSRRLESCRLMRWANAICRHAAMNHSRQLAAKPEENGGARGAQQ